MHAASAHNHREPFAYLRCRRASNRLWVHSNRLPSQMNGTLTFGSPHFIEDMLALQQSTMMLLRFTYCIRDGFVLWRVLPTDQVKSAGYWLAGLAWKQFQNPKGRCSGQWHVFIWFKLLKGNFIPSLPFRPHELLEALTERHIVYTANDELCKFKTTGSVSEAARDISTPMYTALADVPV